MIIRLPKLRGFRNKPKWESAVIFNLGMLSPKLKSHVNGTALLEVNPTLLKAMKLVKKDSNAVIKLLGTGDIAFAINVKGIEVSKSAKMKIEKAGGKIAAV